MLRGDAAARGRPRELAVERALNMTSNTTPFRNSVRALERMAARGGWRGTRRAARHKLSIDNLYVPANSCPATREAAMRLIIALPTALALGIAAGAAVHAQQSTQHIVRMAGSTYAPALINARVGDTIRFENDDTEIHIVYVPTFGHGINLGGPRPSQSVEMRLGKAGTFRVECVPHANMLVTVNVAR
jgi:plastocyanin